MGELLFKTASVPSWRRYAGAGGAANGGVILAGH